MNINLAFYTCQYYILPDKKCVLHSSISRPTEFLVNIICVELAELNNKSSHQLKDKM